MKAQLESGKRDMLVYKQMVFELKTVLKTKKDKKVKKALVMEIRTNEDIIKSMIHSGIPDVPLPPEIELQITVDKNKTGTQTGSKSPRMRSQAATEEAGKKTEEGGGKQGRKMTKLSKAGEPPEDENEKAKNRSNRQQEKETEQEEFETEGEKAKNRQKQTTSDTMDLFALPDFLEDDDVDDYEPPIGRKKRRVIDDEDDDVEPPVRKRRKGKAVPLIEDEEDDENEEGDDDDNEKEDEDYVVEEGDNNDEQDDDEEGDEEITLQTGKAEQRKQKKANYRCRHGG